MNPTSLAAFSLAAFGIVLNPVSAVLLIKRRNCFPVSGRNLPLVLAQVVANLYSIITLASTFLPGMPCAVTHWLNAVGIVNAANFILVRAWDLTFRYGLTQELMQEDPYNNNSTPPINSRDSITFNRPIESRSSVYSDTSNPANPSKWYTNHAKYINPSFLIVATLITNFTLAAVIGVAYTVLNPWILDFSKGIDPPCEPISNHVLGVVLAMAIFVVGLTAYHVKGVREGLMLKKELFIASSSAAVILIATYLGERTLRVDTLCWLIWNVWFQWPTFIIPALWSFRYSAPAVGDNSAKNIALVAFEQIVSNPRTIRAFEAFLAKEFALENLYFYLAVEQYRRISRTGYSHQIRRAARRIHDRFIDENGELSVNIAHRVRLSIKELFAPTWDPDYCPPETVFDEAQAEIVDMVKLHAMGRFLLSPEYEAYLQEDPSANIGSMTTALSFFSYELGRATVDEPPPGFELKIVPPDTPRSYSAPIDGIGTTALDSPSQSRYNEGLELMLLAPPTPINNGSFVTKVDGIGANALDTPRQVRFTDPGLPELKLISPPSGDDRADSIGVTPLDSPRQVRLLEKLEKLEEQELEQSSGGGERRGSITGREIEVELRPMRVD